jgi:hypothetical protein
LGAAFLVAAAPGACAANTADKIISAFVRASGGSKAMNKIHSSSWQGTVAMSGGAESGEFTLLTRAPGQFYREFVIGPQQTAEGCNETSCWSRDGKGNLYTLFGAAENREQATAQYLNFALANYKKLKIRASLSNAETIDGHLADVVQLQIPPGETRRVYFDRSTHLIVKEVVESSDAQAAEEKPAGTLSRVAAADSLAGAEEISYSEYRPVQGIMEPFQMTIRRGGDTFDVKLDSISFNSAVNASSFAFPNFSHKPLPDVSALLKAVDKNQTQIDEIQKDYACMKQEEEDDVNGKGAVTKRTVTLYQISYVKGHEIARKIEVDGKSLSQAAQQKEDARIQKEVTRYDNEAAAPRKKNDDDVGISDFLRIDRFTNPRWERFRGRDVVVFDFGPNPEYRPKKMVERVIHDLVGTVWVDPQAQDVVRLEARFNTAVRLAGGLLASLRKGSAFQFEQSLVNDQVWLPSFDQVNLGLKVFMLKNFRANVTGRYYAYQKFDVSAKDSVAPPKR